MAEKRYELQKKLKKDASWKWSEKDTDIIKNIKKECQELQPLELPLEDDYIIIETDASNIHWGAVLKVRRNEEIICRYTSGTFTETEQKYHSTEKEILAIIKSFEKFQLYILGKMDFLVRTDYKGLTTFLNKHIKQFESQRSMGRKQRWQAILNQYHFRIEHIKGKENSLVDSLTRELNNCDNV